MLKVMQPRVNLVVHSSRLIMPKALSSLKLKFVCITFLLMNVVSL